MNFLEYKYLILSDLYRKTGKADKKTLLKKLFFGESYKFLFWKRTCKYVKSNKYCRYTIFPLSLIFYFHYQYKFGIYIPLDTEIGCGFYIGHFGNIFISPQSKIGKNCNISQGTTLGQTNRGNKKGAPILGENVYIGPGVKIIGNIYIGNNVAIGANCVVTKDIPNNAVVVGVPGKIISYKGSADYVENVDYEDKI